MQTYPSDSIWLLDSRFIGRVQSAMRELVADTGSKRQLAGQSRRKSRSENQPGKVGVVNISGPVEARQTFLGWLMGAVPMDEIGDTIDAAVKDPSVASIVLRIDSPGGTATGTPELADRIYAARGKKPITAIADSMAASAAYWIGSAADRLYVTPSGEVGSIGVFSIHFDESAALASDGVKPTIIRSGMSPYKAEWSSLAPLSKEARDAEQQNVDRLHSEFVQGVARNRGVSASTVLRSFGQGRTVDANAALAAGMVDDVMPYSAFSQMIIRDTMMQRPIGSGKDVAARLRHEDRMMRQRNEQRLAELATLKARR